MRSTRTRRAAMIGTAALLLVAPCATLAQAEPTAPTPELPADLVAAIGRDLKLSPAQYLDQAETGQELAAFADTLRGKFPELFAGAWLDQAGTPLVGLADGPDKAAARTAVEAAGYRVKDQPRSERTLFDLSEQLNTWVQQLPAPLAGLINGTKIDTVNSDIALGVKDTAEGQGLQLPDFLKFVHVAKGPAQGSPELPGLGSLGSSGSSDPIKPTEPTDTTIALDPVTGATVGKKITLKAKVNPAAAGGTVEFKDGDEVLGTVQVGANGEATYQWIPTADGKRTVTATFSGRDGVKGSTTTGQVTVAKAGSNSVASTTTLEPVKGATVGKAITLKAKVNPAAAGGTVEFKDGDTVLGVGQVGANGEATQQWTPAADGQRTITATFSGRDGVTGSTTTGQVTVAKAGSNPVASTTTLDPIKGATVGQAITLKAKVNPAAAGGTVVFEDDKNSYEEVPVGADGIATMEWTPETAGKITVKAIFSGRDGVTGSTTTGQVTVAPADSVASTVALDPIKGATVGKAITLKAKVNPAAAGGTITFEVNEGTLRNISNEASVGADGTATMEWTPENAGKATIDATFSGRDGVTGSTTTGQVTVAKPTTTPKPPANAIMGGDTYDGADIHGHSYMCTLAFNGTDRSGHAVTIAAGHCDPSSAYSGTPDATVAYEVVGGVRGARVGAFERSVVNRLDYSVIKIDDNAAKRFENNYVRIRGKDPVAITGVADPVVGAPVCLSGQTSGYKCGKVREATTSKPAPADWGVNLRTFTAGICSLPGDSGGAFFTGTKALGILSQGNTTSQADCDKWANLDVPEFYKPYGRGTPIAEVLAANPGLKIRTN